MTQESSFPGQMPPPQQPVQGMPAAARPKDVETSFKLWIAAMVVNLIGGIVGYFLIKDAFRQQAEIAARRQGPQVDADTIATAGAVGGLVVAIVVTALWLLFAVKMRQGRNWARITMAVLGGLYVLFTLVGLLTGPTPLLSLVLNIVLIVLVVAAVVFMFRPATKPYFEQPRS